MSKKGVVTVTARGVTAHVWPLPYCVGGVPFPPTYAHTFTYFPPAYPPWFLFSSHSSSTPKICSFVSLFDIFFLPQTPQTNDPPRGRAPLPHRRRAPNQGLGINVRGARSAVCGDGESFFGFISYSFAALSFCYAILCRTTILYNGPREISLMALIILAPRTGSRHFMLTFLCFERSQVRQAVRR
jgi:hypothetical protein